MERTDYKKIIRELMGDYRYNHSVNVADEAVKLAELYGCDVEKAYTAGILHDITKEIPKDEQLQIIESGGIILDDVQKGAPKLWHAVSGSVYVQTKLGITDIDIINAIRYHTTGRAYSGVEVMRQLSRKSLEDAMIFSYQFTFNKLSSLENPIHPDELFGYNDIVLQRNRKD